MLFPLINISDFGLEVFVSNLSQAHSARARNFFERYSSAPCHSTRRKSGSPLTQKSDRASVGTTAIILRPRQSSEPTSLERPDTQPNKCLHVRIDRFPLSFFRPHNEGVRSYR